MCTVKYYKPKQCTINRDVVSLFCCQSLGGKKQISCYSRVVAKLETKKRKKKASSLSNIINPCIFFCR